MYGMCIYMYVKEGEVRTYCIEVGGGGGFSLTPQPPRISRLESRTFIEFILQLHVLYNNKAVDSRVSVHSLLFLQRRT